MRLAILASAVLGIPLNEILGKDRILYDGITRQLLMRIATHLKILKHAYKTAVKDFGCTLTFEQFKKSIGAAHLYGWGPVIWLLEMAIRIRFFMAGVRVSHDRHACGFHPSSSSVRLTSFDCFNAHLYINTLDPAVSKVILSNPAFFKSYVPGVPGKRH